MRKRIMALFLTVMMLVSAFPMLVSADGYDVEVDLDSIYAIDVVVAETTAQQGATVKVGVSVKDNTFGISAAMFQLIYDSSVLTLVSEPESEYFDVLGDEDGLSANPYTTLLTAKNGAEVGGDVVLVEYTFKVAREAALGKTAVSIETRGQEENGVSFEIIDKDRRPISHKVTFGSVDVTEGPAYLPGDVNGDGSVTNRDASRLLQHIAGWDVEYVEEALDANGDGTVSNRDASRILQYLAGWPVELH